MHTIPSLDLSLFLSKNPSEKQQFVTQLGNAFEEIGFISLKNHFLSETLTTQLYKEIKAFFDLPKATKKAYEISKLHGQRGYTSFRKEQAVGHKKADLKEFWHFGQEPQPDLEYTKDYHKNIQVTELPNFNQIGMEAFKMLEKTGQYLLKAIALYLELPETYFDKWSTNGNSILRPIHYPPITEEPKDAIRAGAHGDINLITLLMGASTGGLQVLNKQEQWIDAAPHENELVINVGDMLERLTNNKLRSTIHRVINPPKESWHEPRYSIPFFMHPRLDMPLNCLEACIDKTHPKAHDDILAGDFLYERLVAIGLIK
ncbi:isopenicillin N synthase family dioxygenase [Aquimarina agarilytica]|uniref:isopenicillin N synthase family dioxygenase n=1 Tax=Aquimarina agarilytica TaxID=1087449 RepID=UPI000288E476|nr:2-oxoglutarate and iron-dependent oxygenase domain-containing protein [Aquimarina agarilytica]